MPLMFTPNTEQQPMNPFTPLPEGQYKFKVMEAVEKISGNGNQYISLTLKIYTDNGKERKVWDKLVNHPKSLFKIKHFCESTRLDQLYNTGSVSADDCLDREGECWLTIDKDDVNRNAIKYYIASNKDAHKKIESMKALYEPAKSTPELNDDIPF